MMHPITARKQDQKARASLIKTAKSHRKSCIYGHVPHLEFLRRQYRIFHIAYCEFRGRTRDQIEKPAPENKLTENEEQHIRGIKRWLETDIRWYERDREELLKFAGYASP